MSLFSSNLAEDTQFRDLPSPQLLLQLRLPHTPFRTPSLPAVPQTRQPFSCLWAFVLTLASIWIVLCSHSPMAAWVTPLPFLPHFSKRPTLRSENWNPPTLIPLSLLIFSQNLPLSNTAYHFYPLLSLCSLHTHILECLHQEGGVFVDLTH